MPLVRAVAPPPLLPPAERPRFQGLQVAPNTVLKVCEPAPNSGTLLLPTMTAPAARMRATIRSSRSATASR